ncbi:MAG TPA: alpha/beta hydrolase [Solirubrobacteraceae bacterium]
MRRRAAVLLAVLASLAAGAAPAPVAAAGPTAATAPTRIVHVRELTLGYRSIGTGRPVVFIMGLGGAMDAWDPTFLDALAARRHRVLVFDNEGIGRSTTRRGILTIRRMGDDAAGLIRALHLRGADVVGWSMGGMIAQSLAVRHPRSLRRLVLLATAPGDGKVVPPLPDALAVLGGGATANPAALLGLLFPPDQTEAMTHYVSDLALRTGFAGIAPARVTARQLGAATVWTQGGDRDGKRVARLRLPVLIGGGAEDHLLPIGNQRHLARLIPGARLLVYPDSAHAFFFQNAADFLPRLDDFLAG